MDKYNYEMTKYPNIYKNCYWGLIKYDICLLYTSDAADE